MKADEARDNGLTEIGKSGVDPKAFGKVAVLMGGESAEREVSLNSGRLVLAALRERGVDAHAFDPSERALFDLQREGFVRVFNALHGGYGENGTLQGALEFLGIRYSGTGVLGSALGMDKLRSKLIWQQTGIPTPPFEIVHRGEDYAARVDALVAKLGLPLFVKPASEGSSVAVIKVKSADALASALAEAAQFDPIVLVEKSIDGGGEFTLSIAGELDLPIIRIVPAGEFYDYHAKYIANDTQYLIPSGLSEADENRFKALSRRAFEVLGCSDWGRADFMLDVDGNPYFLEVNTAPGMTDHSLPPKAARAVGISYADLVMTVLAQTLETQKK
jgi:D-alanine-D-alanine ligase